MCSRLPPKFGDRRLLCVIHASRWIDLSNLVDDFVEAGGCLRGSFDLLGGALACGLYAAEYIKGRLHAGIKVLNIYMYVCIYLRALCIESSFQKLPIIFLRAGGTPRFSTVSAASDYAR